MSNFNLNILPAQTEFVLKPGISLTQAYQLTNNSDDNLYLRTEVLPWIPIGTDGNVSYDNIVSNPDISFSLNNADLKLNQAFILKPHESRQLVLKISSSSQIELNDYYYTFFVRQDLNQVSVLENSVSQAVGKIGSHLLLSVSNNQNIQSNFEIKKFNLFPKIKDVFLTPIEVNAEIKNNSDYYNRIKGTISITKNNLKIRELNLVEDNVLAHHSRTIACQNQNTCSISPPFWPGRYTASLILDPSLNAKPISVSFYVFPFSLIFIILFFIGIVIVFKKKTPNRGAK